MKKKSTGSICKVRSLSKQDIGHMCKMLQEEREEAAKEATKEGERMEN